MTIIIGNIFALIASIVMVIASYIKNKEKFLILQSIQIFLFVLSNIVLGGISGAIVNALSVLRNILCYKNKLTKTWIIIICLLMIVLSIIYNKNGLIGLLPIIASVMFTVTINTKNELALKVMVIISFTLWLIFDYTIKSYVSTLFDAIGIVAAFVATIQLIKLKKSIENKNSNSV